MCLLWKINLNTNREFGGITGEKDDTLSDLRSHMRVALQNRLEKMIKIDEQRFSEVLREWVNDTNATVQPA
ncbi:hypothetical protein ME3_01067 [Bartonella melophagi K-2C]|uniref:Uncharacterized protein n=2 Tax=Bartonella melophagi TaxID=291176 RepID=J1JVF1_9HYPH|nr:hypothetical protein ME3_01067 [Bartonella melophagi K-2C]